MQPIIYSSKILRKYFWGKPPIEEKMTKHYAFCMPFICNRLCAGEICRHLNISVDENPEAVR